MRIIFFFGIISLVLLSILEEANSMPRGEAKEKKAGGALSPTKPKSPAKAKAKSPGKAKQANEEAKAAEKEAKAHSKKDEKLAKNGEEKVSDSSPSKVSLHTDKDKKAKSPAKKDKGPMSPVKSPKREDKHKVNLKIAERAEAKSPTKTAKKDGKKSQMGGEGKAAEKAQAEESKQMTSAKGAAAEMTASGNAIELAADEQRPSSSLATSDQSSANEFGSFEPEIVAYSEFCDDDLDTSGSDFDLDFTDDEDELFSEDGNYFDFGDEWTEEGQFEGTELVGNMPEVLVH